MKYEQIILVQWYKHNQHYAGIYSSFPSKSKGKPKMEVDSFQHGTDSEKYLIKLQYTEGRLDSN